MNLLADVINYVRRIIKSSSNSSITDALIIDYINRFWILDVDARIQLFDLKMKYGFMCVEGVTSYNMPLYGINSFATQYETAGTGNQSISAYPVYQGFMDPAYVNGIQIPFYTQRDAFYKIWTPYLQQLPNAAEGDGGATYDITLPNVPALRGHIDISGIIASGSSIDPIVGSSLNDDTIVDSNPPLTSLSPSVFITAFDSNNKQMLVTDSGQFKASDQNVGFLQTVSASDPQTIISAGTVNYATGAVSVTFPSNVSTGNAIQANCNYYNPGIPRAILFYNNVLTISPPPDVSYYVEMDAYLSPAAFLNGSSALQFAYMAEYIARGAARKILSDTGDIEQFQFYEPLFREQESLVWKRSQRQFTSVRTGTIFSDLQSQNTTNSYGTGSV